MKRPLTFAIVLLAVLAAFRAEAAIQLRLRAEPASQLPAIEPTLRVEATNIGSAPAELPMRAVLQVTPSGDRAPFFAYTGPRGEDFVTWFLGDGDDWSLPIVLAPGETRDVSFWAGPESPVWFAADSRLLSPGTYRLQLVADTKLDSGALEKVARAIDQPGLLNPVVSNEATYTVETPTGADAAVWALIKQLPSPMFWRDTLGRQIWEQYPSSRYAAFSLRDPHSTDPPISISVLEATLAKVPSASWAEWYRLGIAQAEIRRSLDFISARDAEGGFAAIERAKTIVTKLITDSPSPYMRRQAQEILDRNVMTHDQVVDYIKRSSGEIREVRPFVACLEPAEGGKHIFWFGYDNTARDPLSIPIGKENKFTPPPFDRGQPTVFPIHEVALGVRVLTDEPAVTWHVGKYNVHASVAKTEPCPANLHERFKYEPPLRD